MSAAAEAASKLRQKAPESGAFCRNFGSLSTVIRDDASTTVATAAPPEHALRTAAGEDWRTALPDGALMCGTPCGPHPKPVPPPASYRLGQAIDRAGARLILHGHAHMGTERGRIPGGIRVRNAARPVLHSAYRVSDPAAASDEPGWSRAPRSAEVGDARRQTEIEHLGSDLGNGDPGEQRVG